MKTKQKKTKQDFCPVTAFGKPSIIMVALYFTKVSRSTNFNLRLKKFPPHKNFSKFCRASGCWYLQIPDIQEPYIVTDFVWLQYSDK